MSTLIEPAAMVANALASRADAERPAFLRALLAHAAAGLVVIEGDSETAEALYRLADAVVARGHPRVVPT